MMRALYSSVAGLKTHQTKMDVIGNNIANVNTVGFKSTRTTFSTMMYQNTAFASGPNAEMGKGGVNAKQIGLGVTFASTSIDIDTGGASETTGKAFDLKLSDKNSTSFYIVNTGSENVFTRAGAFYVDGAGNLCMESTGYQVMGWQVDANGNIRKDTVTPLRVMSAENQTSQPEYTTNGMCTGILDDNNSNVNSDKGYIISLGFYDNLGYSYTARFAAQKTGEKGEYTINLTDILDANGVSILTADANVGLGDLWGGGQGSNVVVTDSYKIASGMGNTMTQLANNIVTAAGATGAPYNFTSEYLNEVFATNKADQLPEGLRVEAMISSATDASGVTTYTFVSARVLDSNGSVYSGSLPQWLTNGQANGTDINPIRTHSVREDLQQEYERGNLSTVTDATGAVHYVLGSSQASALYQKYESYVPALATAGYSPGDLWVTVDAAGQVTGLTLPDGTTNADLGTFATALFGSTYDDRLINHVGDGYLVLNTTDVNTMGVFTTDLPKDVEVRYKFGERGAWSYEIVTPGTDGYKAQFSTADGSLTYIGSQGNTTQTLRLSNYMAEGNPFSDIEIDFSTLQNLSNGGSSTAAMSNGSSDGTGDGKHVGALIGLSVDQSGKIYGSYDNGNTTLLGQIAVARFGNASGLESIGNNCYRTTMNSGLFDGIGVEMDSDGSSIDSGTLEMSNVDLATEFTQMITTQRGYQANSRVISTSDSILEELVNLKR